MAGIHTMSDKHIAITKAELDGNARPGQIVVDTEDYSLWVGNDDGDLIAAGAGGGGGGTPVGPTGALQYVGADGALAGTDGMVYNPDYQQLTVGPEVTNGDGSTSLVGSIAAGYIYADGYVGGRQVYSRTYVEQGATVEDDGTGTHIVDLTAACYFVLESVTGPVTLGITTYSTEGPYASKFTMHIVNGAGMSVTWWPGALWADGTPPVLTGGIDIIEFITLNGGASTIGYVKVQNVY